jgi:hypothetical protein
MAKYTSIIDYKEVNHRNNINLGRDLLRKQNGKALQGKPI